MGGLCARADDPSPIYPRGVRAQNTNDNNRRGGKVHTSIKKKKNGIKKNKNRNQMSRYAAPFRLVKVHEAASFARESASLSPACRFLFFGVFSFSPRVF